jgi:pimeloyl-ACP methyl ester carboxylesterase
MPESERRGWHFAMEQALRAGNIQAIRELDAIAPYAAPGQPIPLDDLYVQRKWMGEYGGAVAYRDGFGAEIAAVALSPEYTDADLARMWEGTAQSAEKLLEEVVMIDWSDVTTFEVPVIIFNGRHDRNASASVAAEWFERVQAPSKAMVWFEHSAHEMFNEEPGKFLVSLVQQLRPIAERAGDVPP